MTPVQCQRNRTQWEAYEVGGSQYDKVSALTRSSEISKFKKIYSDGGCGKDILMEKCLELEATLTNIREKESIDNQQRDSFSYGYTIASIKKNFTSLGCEKKIEESRQVVVGNVINKYSELDKQRIEADSKYQLKIRIFIGASVLLVGLALMITSKRK
jgi:hypothetical protein